MQRSPDFLHQFSLGIIKKIIKWTMSHIKEVGGPGALNEFDKKLAEMGGINQLKVITL